MKKAHKDEVRCFIINQLYDIDDLRWKLDGLADTYDMDSFEVLEIFQNEVERINKFYNKPAQ